MTEATKTAQAPSPAAQQEEEFYDGYEDYDEEEDLTCNDCHGTGGNPWDDFITPCPACDGEGHKWWL